MLKATIGTTRKQRDNPPLERKRAETEGVNAWVDPEGYRRFVAGKRRAFEDEGDAEMGVEKDSR